MALTKISRSLLDTGVSDSSDATAITIDSSERVGIGTSSPASNLHIATTAEARLIVEGDTNNDGGEESALVEFRTDSANVRHRIEAIGAGANDLKISAGSADSVNTLNCQIRFETKSAGSATTERMRINATGDILCGMTSASYLAAQSGIQIKAAGNIRIGGDGTSARNVMAFVNGTDGTPAQVGYIQTSGTATLYGTSSDYRLKENIDYEFDALARVKQLKPARFNFIADTETIVDGFLAHEVSDIVPEAISGTKDAVDDEGNPEYQGIDHSKLVPLLTKAVQEQQTQIEELRQKIETLKN